MLRLTALLVAAIYVTLAVWGEPRGEVEVTRSAGLDAPLLGDGRAATRVPAAARVPVSPAEAIELALAAGEVARPATGMPAEMPAAVPPTAAEAEAPVFFVTGNRVNFRAGPSTAEAVVGQFRLGEAAEVLSDPAGSWVRVRDAEGREGFVAGRFLAPEPLRG